MVSMSWGIWRFAAARARRDAMLKASEPQKRMFKASEAWREASEWPSMV